MTKGTPSFGRHNKKTHIVCRRCGKHAYHVNRKTCAHCGFPAAKLRDFRWQWKDINTKKRKR